MAMTTPRRLARTAVALQPFNPRIPCICFLPLLSHPNQTRRTIRLSARNREKEERKTIDPLDPKFREVSKPGDGSQNPPEQGSLARGSIIDEEGQKTPKTSESEGATTHRRVRDLQAMASALDPIPENKQRWLRKMLIKRIRKGNRLSKTEKIMRTERQHLAKSHFFKTSIKKLFPLARQIAGKPIEEAIVQMRFSKKRAAAEVKEHLEYARDEATVARGMGLGDKATNDGRKGQVVEDKNGIKRWVSNKTNMYVDQAWVGRGSYTKEPSYRAKGRVDVLRHPTTSISVLLKEEATRIRLAEEREHKHQNRKVWVPLPDRPVTAQRQYPLW